MPTDRSELLRISAEAADIAQKTTQRVETSHLLLAIFTLPGRADALLRERGCDEDRILAALGELGPARQEPSGLVEQALERARQLARDCQNPQPDGLHLLVALTRLTQSNAARLLEHAAGPLSSLRTAVLGELTGALPSRVVRREEVQVAALATVAPAHFSVGHPGPAPAHSVPAGAHSVPSAAHSVPAAAHSLPAAAHSVGPAGHSVPAVASPHPVSLSGLEPRGRVEPAAAQRRALGSLDPREYPFLCTHGRNLTALAAEGRLDPALGRDAEVEELLDILGKRRANNPVLVGEPGVGKTAIVEGMALRMVQRARPTPDGVAELERVLIELDVAGLVAGTHLRGSFSERLLGIKEEVRRAEGRVVVFIDELHMLIGAGAAGEGPQDAANELKAALARGEFPCVGATTHDEFRKHIQGDPALERRFVPVLVREPSPAAAHRILIDASARYEQHHGVRFEPDALEAAAHLSARYVRDRFLPDKAFAAIDLAGSRVRRDGRSEVTRADVARAVARMAGLPEESVLAPDGERFLTLERRLGERIVGHDAQISAVARAIRRNFAGFSGHRPLASFLFVGPSGVGKTETARVLADELFPAPAGEAGAAAALVRLDLSEYAEPHSVARLVGAPPGYVGYGDGGLLTEAVRRRPACVVLLDEVDKAHPSVLQLLLQILDEGQLTDGRGRRIDFSAAVLILTGNLGAAAFGEASRAVGFASGPTALAAPGAAIQADPGAPTLPPAPAVHPAAGRALEVARAALPAELWSRLDEKLVFAPLERDEFRRVAQLLLAASARRLGQERRITFRPGPGLLDALVDRAGTQPALGARPLRQAIQRLVESPLADEILAGRVQPGARLLVCADARGIEFRRDEI